MEEFLKEIQKEFSGEIKKKNRKEILITLLGESLLELPEAFLVEALETYTGEM